MAYSDYAGKVIAKYPSGMRRYKELLTGYALNPGAKKVLHLGCGHDLGGLVNIFPLATEVVGIDPDAGAIAKYPGVGYVGDGADMPFPDAEFDFVFSEMVLEHLDDPGAVFIEVSRVLKKGGRFISVTPNLLSYKSIAAALTPHRFHRAAVRILRRDSPREDGDVYPTRYRANTSRALRRNAQKSGLTLGSLEYVDNGPTWFQRIPGLFELGRVYHWMLRANALAWLRCNLVCVLVKEQD